MGKDKKWTRTPRRAPAVVKPLPAIGSWFGPALANLNRGREEAESHRRTKMAKKSRRINRKEA